MKHLLLLFFFAVFPAQSIFSQVLLKGKVVSDASNLDDIYVINRSTKQETMTSKGGFFTISAKEKDTLLFSGMQVQGIQVVLKAADFSENVFFVRLKSKVNLLDEVVIKNYSEINAVSLGIIPKNTKSYTPAQRRLRTASSPDVSLQAGGMMGGSVGVDPLINWITGRTAMLKKELQVEGKERLIARLSALYEDVFFVETLKIPSEYIKGFKIYALDDEKLTEAVKAKNSTLTTFLLGELAEKYKAMTFPKKN